MQSTHFHCLKCNPFKSVLYYIQKSIQSGSIWCNTKCSGFFLMQFSDAVSLNPTNFWCLVLCLVSWFTVSCLFTWNHKYVFALLVFTAKASRKIALASCQEVDSVNPTVDNGWFQAGDCVKLTVDNGCQDRVTRCMHPYLRIRDPRTSRRGENLPDERKKSK